MDTGNNNDIPTLLKSNFPPYGKEFPGGIPTGRFSDGKVPSDIIGIKSFIICLCFCPIFNVHILNNVAKINSEYIGDSKDDTTILRLKSKAK